MQPGVWTNSPSLRLSLNVKSVVDAFPSVADQHSKLVGGFRIESPNGVCWPDMHRANHQHQGDGRREVFIAKHRARIPAALA